VASMAVSVSDMAQQCDPDVLQQVDSPKIRRICNFLQNYAVAMQQLNREGGGELFHIIKFSFSKERSESERQGQG